MSSRAEQVEWADERKFRVGFFVAGRRTRDGLEIVADVDGLKTEVVQAEQDPGEWFKWLGSQYPYAVKLWGPFEELLARHRGTRVIVVSRDEKGPGFGLCRIVPGVGR